MGTKRDKNSKRQTISRDIKSRAKELYLTIDISGRKCNSLSKISDMLLKEYAKKIGTSTIQAWKNLPNKETGLNWDNELKQIQIQAKDKISNLPENSTNDEIIHELKSRALVHDYQKAGELVKTGLEVVEKAKNGEIVGLLKPSDGIKLVELGWKMRMSMIDLGNDLDKQTADKPNVTLSKDAAKILAEKFNNRY